MINERLEDIANGLTSILSYKITGENLVIKLNENHLLSIFIKASDPLNLDTRDEIYYSVKTIQTGNVLDEGYISVRNLDKAVEQNGHWINIKEDDYKGCALDEILYPENVIPNTMKEIQTLVDFYAKNFK